MSGSSAPSQAAGPYVVAVDLGGSLTKIGYATPDGALADLDRVPTRFSERSVAPEWLAELIAAKAATRDAAGCVGYGVAVPGVIDTLAGVVRAAPNVGWRDLSLRSMLDERLRLPGAVGHDVRAAGLAEWRLGSDAGTGAGGDNLIFLALGTGIAAALVVDGRMLEADGFAGEIGHLRVPAGGDHRCACGLYGCLETVASAAGVARSHQRLTGQRLPAEMVASLARGGDQAAKQAFAVAAEGLAEALTACIALLGPERVVLGGGLSGAADLLLADLGWMLADRLSFHRAPNIEVAALGADAGVIGAGLLGWQSVRATSGRDHHRPEP